MSTGSDDKSKGAAAPDHAETTFKETNQQLETLVSADIDELAQSNQEDVPTATATPVIVEEDVVPKRIRRPWDLLRMLVALLAIAAVVAVSFFATATTAGIGEDIGKASKQLPEFVTYAIDLVGVLGLLALPVSAAIYLLIRKRGRQLLEALLGMLAAIVVLVGASAAIMAVGSERFVASLAGTASADQIPVAPLLAGLIAFVTTARLMARVPWAVASVVVLGSLSVLLIISADITISGIAISLLAGWAIGLAVRYGLGTPTTRPSGIQIAHTLAQAGLPVIELKALETTLEGRRYSAAQLNGPDLDVFVLDRDLEGAGLGQAAWASLRLRDPGRSSFTLRRGIDHRALMAYAAEVGDIPAVDLLAAREINPDSSLLAYEKFDGVRLDKLASDDISDEVLEKSWRAVAGLRHAGIAHRQLNAHNIGITDDGDVQLLRIGNGTVAAGDVALRIDIAELLCSQALLVGPERTIAAAKKMLGSRALTTALPALQPVALSPITRKAIRKNKKLLVSLRDALTEINPDAEIETIEIERIKPKTIIMVLAGTIAGYIVVLQLTKMLSGVDLGDMLAKANWWWVLAGLGASIITYPAAAWSLSGFVPEKLKLFPTTMTQLAGDFVTLITPPTLGAVAINLRYLQKMGIHPALATASIGVSQVGAFAVHTLLLLGFGIAAGSQNDFSIHVPTFVLLLILGVFIVAAGLIALQPTRRLIWRKLGPVLKQVGPRLLTVAQTPLKLLEGFGGMLLLNAGYIACLAACVHAFNGDLSIAAIAVVYLTGSVIGQAAPTPGGLGAVELAMTAGLTAAGMPAGVALTAVLVYRMLTFILPTVPGWFAFNWLQKKQLL